VESTTPASTDPFDTNGGGWVDAAGFQQHPGYASAVHDVGVVTLYAQPDGIDPLPLGGAPEVGSTVRAIGYGFNTPSATGGGGAGTKRLVDITVNSVSAPEVSAAADPSGTCP